MNYNLIPQKLKSAHIRQIIYDQNCIPSFPNSKEMYGIIDFLGFIAKYFNVI